MSNVSSSPNVSPSSLYKRISMAGDPRASMVPILDQWVSDGHEIRTSDLRTLVSRLRSFRRLQHAFQISEWMSMKRSSSLSPKDIATHMELMCKVVGLDQAEKYVFELPESLMSPVIYNGLLNCYASTKSVKKAEDVMQKMKNLGFTKVAVPYNIMLKMYFQMKNYDKVEQIMQEMEAMGLTGDTFTERVQLTAYSTAGKVKEMEMVLLKMEANPMNTMTCSDYITAANVYLKAGIVDKSLALLRRAECLASGAAKKHVFQCLLTMYAHANVKEEVLRIWDLYKKSWDVHNKGYLSMISALVKLNDLEGAEKIVDEWADSISSNSQVDFRIINPLARAFSKKGDLDRAQTLIDRLTKRLGKEPHRSTWEVMVTGYCLHGRMEDAVKVVKKALVAGHGRPWKFRRASLARCLDYLSKKGSPEELQEYRRLLEEYGYTEEDLSSIHFEHKEKLSALNDDEVEDDRKSQEFIIGKTN